MAEETNHTMEEVLEVKRHTGKLMSFTITRPESFRFQAGQFARLGKGEVWRAYSIVSPEYEDTLEFFVVLISEGPMSQEFDKMKVGDKIALAKLSTGFLLPGRFPDGDNLVMLSTGSGIAPFISQIQDPKLFERFKKVALVHSVSHADELVFADFFKNFKNHPLAGSHAGDLTYIPIVTREKVDGALNKRIPAALKDGDLQSLLPFEFEPGNTRVMVCGNPDMVMDTLEALRELGFKPHRNKVPGQIIMENGF